MVSLLLMMMMMMMMLVETLCSEPQNDFNIACDKFVCVQTRMMRYRELWIQYRLRQLTCK